MDSNPEPVGEIVKAYAVYECEACGEEFTVETEITRAPPLYASHEECQSTA